MLLQTFVIDCIVQYYIFHQVLSIDYPVGAINKRWFFWCRLWGRCDYPQDINGENRSDRDIRSMFLDTFIVKRSIIHYIIYNILRVIVPDRCSRRRRVWWFLWSRGRDPKNVQRSSWIDSLVGNMGLNTLVIQLEIFYNNTLIILYTD